MKPKNIVSVVLLVFVAASVVYLVASESRPQAATDQSDQEAGTKQVSSAAPAAGPAAVVEPAGVEPAAVQAVEEETAAEEDVAVEQAGEVKTEHRLIAYYFHRTQRCRKCLTMEAYAEEALTDAFPDALASGELEWHAVNVEDPENEHFVEDYQLTASALVLVDMQDGQQMEWRNLKRVWELVGNELEFKAYVEGEALAFLE